MRACGRPPSVTTMAATAAIEDFRYDKLKTEGKASEVCVGGLQTGTAWAFNEVRNRFGGSAGTMYFCRERWDVATNPDCNGTLVNPVTQPNFMSTCWSNHAQGRAFDLMVGRVGSSYNTARGIAIVNWMLAPDSAGNQNAIAHLVSLIALFWGIVLAAEQILPRVGYAASEAVWRCVG